MDLENEVRTLKGTYCTVVNCLVNLSVTMVLLLSLPMYKYNTVYCFLRAVVFVSNQPHTHWLPSLLTLTVEVILGIITHRGTSNIYTHTLFLVRIWKLFAVTKLSASALSLDNNSGLDITRHVNAKFEKQHGSLT